MEVVVTLAPSICASLAFTHYFLPRHEPKLLAFLLMFLAFLCYLIKACAPIIKTDEILVMNDIANGLAMLWLFPMLYIYELGGNDWVTCTKYAVVFVLTTFSVVLLEIVVIGLAFHDALIAASNSFVYLLVLVSLGTSHIYAALGLSEAPKLCMAKLFNILSREQKYKDKYLESAGALTAFERHYSANPLSKEQQSKYTLLQNDLTYAEQKIAKFKAKNDKCTFCTAILLFFLGILMAIIGILTLSLLSVDTIERMMRSSCGFWCGYTGTVTYSQRVVHNLAIDFNMNLPVFIMVFYTATTVCSTIAMGIMGYTFRKNRTKGYTLMILSIQIMMSSYSGSCMINLISPHLWKTTDFPKFISLCIYIGEWVYVIVGVCYVILNICFRFTRGKRKDF